MSSFFGVGVNPFTTQVGQRIEQATDGSLASENWALNMEICDIINETEDGHKDAIKALRKRLQQNAGKNYTVVMYTLTVLETCVKNCDKRFHVVVCNKEFIQELVKLIEPSSSSSSTTTSSWLDTLPPTLQSLSNTITAHLPIDKGPKNDPPTIVQEKVLSLIQSWADAFRNQPEMSGVVQIYQDLKNKGIEFPPTDLDAMAPIHTPQRSIPDADIPLGVPALVAQQEGTLGGSGVSIGSGGAGGGGSSGSPLQPQRLTPDQLNKLRNELDIVQGNMAVLNEMLNELSPGKEHPSDIQLLKELHSTCRLMQQRLVELISKLANDEVTAELLRVNDLLNNLFLRYNRYEKNREMGSREAAGASATTNGQVAGAEGGESLIDLSEEEAALPKINSQLSALSIGASASSQLASMNSVPAQHGGTSSGIHHTHKEDSEFDMFAQSRNVTYESSKLGGSSYEANLKPDQISGGLGAAAQARSSSQAASGLPATTMHKESDFDEMAAWLGEEGAPQESLTSSEFERFLAERAAAAENIPNASSTTTSSPRHRKPHKEKEEPSLFAM
ncbi:target of Myb1 membrane trafficking protein isoform X2 [Lycorma delicatula]|uniref:target of Myb1 membrane trafficking protein isoform X2 n=1 Tax=Lycorma delicatula TaxID=130591 RepID=UPI003F5143F3